MLLQNKIRRKPLALLLARPFGVLLMAVCGVLLTAGIVWLGAQAGIFLLLLLVGIPVVYAIIAYPKVGIVVMLVSAYLVMWIDKMLLSYPLGTVMDALLILLVIAFTLKHKYNKTWDFLRNPISIMLIIWVSYNFIQVANPEATSRMAWLYTIRTIGVVAITYFIFMYHINSVKFIRLIINIWIALSVFAALYSIQQEYFGFNAFEKAWLASDPSSTELYFIAGKWRRFSIFSDPVAAAYNMVISSILCTVLMVGARSLLRKLILAVCIALFVTAMLYSGIRGSFVLIPAAIGLFFMLRLNKKTVFAAMAFGAALVVLIKMPTNNVTIYRFQTAFHPATDQSYNVRKTNQKKIQPYIQSHPMGGGLGSTGAWGQRFSPGTFLAAFPPDSGFIRVAVESGTIGLLLLCALFFVILKQGIKNYFIIRNKELKLYCMAMLLIVFALAIGNYPQEALVQYPINIYFYLAVALINITLKLDKEKQGSLIQVKHQTT